MVSRERKMAGISVSIVTFEDGTICPILYFILLILIATQIKEIQEIFKIILISLICFL
jgi:hypothetical protein